MRERIALRSWRQFAATQMALQAASEASLARSLIYERERQAETASAQARLEESLLDWRGALERSSVDPALLPLFAQAPQRRELELKLAQEELAQAKRQTETHRARLAEISARLRSVADIRRRLAKRLSRKLEERALAALEPRLEWRSP